MEYKNITERQINGYTVVSKTCVLTPEEEEEKLSEIKTNLRNICRSLQKKNPTA